MCNQVHAYKFESIPTKGTGWKIFRKCCLTDYGKIKEKWLGPLYGFADKYLYKDKDGFISWADRKYMKDGYWYTSSNDYGFCFFLTREAARKASKSCANKNDKVIRKIQYKHGRGSFVSTELDGKPRRFAIAKKFKILEGR